MLIFSITVLNMASLCKAEEGGVAVATLTDDNATDDVIDSAGMLIINVSVH